LTEWTVSGPEGGIAITPVAKTEYHPLLEGGGATGCGIDTKVELRKIIEIYHFLIDQWHCINSLDIFIKYSITVYLPDTEPVRYDIDYYLPEKEPVRYDITYYLPDK
jgi:hypothetical protein